MNPDQRKFDSTFSAPIIPKVTIPSLQLSEEEKKKEQEQQEGQPPIPIFQKIAYQPQLLPQYHSFSQLGDRQTKLFVSKINVKINNDFLLKLLEVCGSVDSWQRVKDPISGVFKTYGFCMYQSADGAIKALRNLNGLDINGDQLLVKAQQDTEAYLREYKVKKSLLLYSGNKSDVPQIADDTILAAAKAEDDEREKQEDLKIREEIISLFVAEQGVSTKLQTLHTTSELGAVNTTIERQFKDVDEKIVAEKKQLMTESIRMFRKKESEREREKIEKEKEREYRKRNESKFNEERIMKRERDRFNFLRDEEERLKRKREKELKYLENREREREYKIHKEKRYSKEQEDEEYLKSKYMKRYEIDHDEAELSLKKRKYQHNDDSFDEEEEEVDDDDFDEYNHQKCLSRKKKYNYYEYFSSEEDDNEDDEIFPEDEEKVVIQIENKEEKKQEIIKEDESIKEIFHQNDEEEDDSNVQSKQNLLINFEEIKNEQEIEKQLNPKNIISSIPDSTDELFKIEINWILVDQFKLIDELKEFIKKKIKEILGSEEETMFDYLVANMSLHCTPETLVSDLEEILGNEANIFVAKNYN
eukprot:gene9702-1907_t